MQRARGVTPLRLARTALTALAVVLGVLAMHAVAGGPHSPRGLDHVLAGPAPLAADRGTPATAGMLEVGAAAHAALRSVDDAASAVVAAAGSALPVVSAPPTPTGDSGAMAAMCATALLVLLVALGFGLLGRAAPAFPATGAPGLVPGRRPVPRAPPRDLLAELCVLRT